MPPMRIAVIGPQNTGKSTFVEDFLAAHPHYSTSNATYRDVVTDMGLEINQKTGEASQRAIRDFLEAQTRLFPGEHVIFDRCVIDNWVYTKAAALKGNVSEAFLIETEGVMRSCLRDFETILFIPTVSGVKLVDDELRDIDRDFIDVVNRLYIDLLFRLRTEIPHKVITITGSRDERVRIAREALGL